MSTEYVQKTYDVPARKSIDEAMKERAAKAKEPQA